MILTKQQLEELEVAAKPLMNWIHDNCHPHVTALVDSNRAELMEGLGTTVRVVPRIPPQVVSK